MALKKTPLKRKTALKSNKNGLVTKTRLKQKISLKAKTPLKAKTALKIKTPLKAKKGLTQRSTLQKFSTLKQSNKTIRRTSFKKSSYINALKKTKLKKNSLLGNSFLKRKNQIRVLKDSQNLERSKLRITVKKVKRLTANPKRMREAKKYHDAVFAKYGPICVLCDDVGLPAIDAAHVIKRSALGNLRYEEPRLARPAHRHCHIQQELNITDFSLEIRIDAIRAYNKITRSKPIPEPTI